MKCFGQYDSSQGTCVGMFPIDVPQSKLLFDLLPERVRQCNDSLVEKKSVHATVKNTDESVGLFGIGGREQPGG